MLIETPAGGVPDGRNSLPPARPSSAGTAAGIIFSYIKTLKNHGDRVLPDRQSVTMEKPFLSAYSRLLIKTVASAARSPYGRYGGVYPDKDAEKMTGC